MTTQPFADRVDIDGECYVWGGALFAGTGYGAVRHQGRVRGAHRVAYELVHGPIGGKVIDHLCRNRACIRIEHLEAVTQAVNVQRGESPSAVTNRTGQCHRGHSMSDAYLAHRSDGRVTKRCRVCHLERQRARRMR